MIRKTFFLILIVICASICFAQEEAVDRLEVELTDPSKPVFVELGLINGGITVTGYEGEQVLVEARTQTQELSMDEENERSTSGMFRIPVFSSSLEVEEYNNRIEISTESFKHTIDINLRVPEQTSLHLSCINNGDITVENVTGDHDVDNINGSVTLLNISGSVVGHALNGDLRVIFNSVDPNQPMSFSSMNGDIDVSFPSDITCDVKIKNDQGEVYSDFEIVQIEKPVEAIEESQGDDGRYRVRIERTFYGQINGGGSEYAFTNFNGDILIRKSD